MGKTILEEAQEITDGKRQVDYGHVARSFSRTRALALAMGIDISEKNIAKLMVCVKLTRESYKHSRDNLVDVCGYARLLSVLEEDEND